MGDFRKFDRNFNRNFKKEKEPEHRINNAIYRQGKISQIRVVGDNIQSSIMSVKSALELADSMNLDLVEINSNEQLPICKIIDYQKFLYEVKKKKKEIDKKNRLNSQETKEIRLTSTIDNHDYEFKKRHIINFLDNNDIVIVSVFFKGREIEYSDKGLELLLKLSEELKDVAIVEGKPKLEGKRMNLRFLPKKKN